MPTSKTVKLTAEQVAFIAEILTGRTMKQVRSALKSHDDNMDYRYARNYAERKLNKATLNGEIHDQLEAKEYFKMRFDERRAELRLARSSS